EFDESIAYKGNGARENNFLAKNALEQEALEPKLIAAKDNMAEITRLMTQYRAAFNEGMSAQGMDPGLKSAIEERNKLQAEQQKKQMEIMKAQMEEAQKLVGKPSPSFDYENFKG